MGKLSKMPIIYIRIDKLIKMTWIFQKIYNDIKFYLIIKDINP